MARLFRVISWGRTSTGRRRGSTALSSALERARGVRKILAIKGKHAVLSSASDIEFYDSVLLVCNHADFYGVLYYLEIYIWTERNGGGLF